MRGRFAVVLCDGELEMTAPSLPPSQWVKIVPTGYVHFITKEDGFHYSWNKPHSTVHNVLFGTLWADHVSVT